MVSSFSDLGVPARLVDVLNAQGLTEPFPIQTLAVPDALAGRDVCGKAPTGSGKTLAFGLALAVRATGSAPRRPRGLVLVPTRELAAQVRDHLTALWPSKFERVIAIYGGTGYGPTARALNKGVDVVVACPGRLEDLLEQGSLNLAEVSLVVIDEADRMADMGFLPAVRRILDTTAANRQVLLFSATIGREVEAIVDRYQHDPARHDVVTTDAGEAKVSHHFWETDREDRVALTAKLVAEHGQAIVFCRTKRGADRVAKQLGATGIRAVAIHGDRTQGQRERALALFGSGKADALVATDVAARGIHVDQLPCVVHFDPPADATSYVHRSGRTGRAGGEGVVVSLVAPDSRSIVREIRRDLGLGNQLEAPGSTVGMHIGQAKVPATPGAQRPVPTIRRDVAPRRRRTQASHRTFGTSPPARSEDKSPEGREFSPAGRARQAEQYIERRAIMPIGTVKFFNNEKGYGFVSRPDGEDVFVHYSNVQGSGFRTLEAGQQVEFDIAPGRKGDEARNVKVI